MPQGKAPASWAVAPLVGDFRWTSWRARVRDEKGVARPGLAVSGVRPADEPTRPALAWRAAASGEVEPPPPRAEIAAPGAAASNRLVVPVALALAARRLGNEDAGATPGRPRPLPRRPRSPRAPGRPSNPRAPALASTRPRPAPRSARWCRPMRCGPRSSTRRARWRTRWGSRGPRRTRASIWR
jgi:hypothetical protein